MTQRSYISWIPIHPVSHPDEDKRRKAIQMTMNSMKHAHDLGAKALVLHCGHVDMDAEFNVLRHYWNNNQIHSTKAQKSILRKLKERDHLKSKHLDSLLFSLDRLMNIAEEKNTLLVIELKPGTPDSKVSQSIRYVQKIFKKSGILI